MIFLLWRPVRTHDAMRMLVEGRAGGSFEKTPAAVASASARKGSNSTCDIRTFPCSRRPVGELGQKDRVSW